MPNTTLPTNVTKDSPNHPDLHNVVNAEVNRLSRDTGLLDLSTYLINGWKLGPGGWAYMRRVDDEVTLYLKQLDGTDASGLLFLKTGNAGESQALSTNFLPSPLSAVGSGVATVSPSFRDPAGGAPWYLHYNGHAQFSVSRIVPATNGSLQWTYKTALPWPSFTPPKVVGA